MNRRCGNRSKKTKTISKSRKNRLEVCKYTKMWLCVCYNERENSEIVTLGPNKLSVSPSVTFPGDLAAISKSEVSARRELTDLPTKLRGHPRWELVGLRLSLPVQAMN